MTKLKDLPPPDVMYKEPETLTPEDKSVILDRLRTTATRYRAARSLLPLAVKKDKESLDG